MKAWSQESGGLIAFRFHQRITSESIANDILMTFPSGFSLGGKVMERFESDLLALMIGFGCSFFGAPDLILFLFPWKYFIVFINSLK